jgi:uncharacterized lipoprotein YajG
MKKIFLNAVLLLSLFATISCVPSQDQKIKLDLSFDETKSELGNGAEVKVLVFDDRSNKEIIGTKKFGTEEINITSEQNLTDLLQKKVSENLFGRGFKKGSAKTFELRIESLNYKAARQFFIGTSKANASIKAVIKNNKNNSKFTKNFDLSLKNKHFIAPLESTDGETINALLQEIIENILSDENLLKSLAQ